MPAGVVIFNTREKPVCFIVVCGHHQQVLGSSDGCRGQISARSRWAHIATTLEMALTLKCDVEIQASSTPIRIEHGFGTCQSPQYMKQTVGRVMPECVQCGPDGFPVVFECRTEQILTVDLVTV